MVVLALMAFKVVFILAIGVDGTIASKTKPSFHGASSRVLRFLISIILIMVIYSRPWSAEVFPEYI